MSISWLVVITTANNLFVNSESTKSKKEVPVRQPNCLTDTSATIIKHFFKNYRGKSLLFVVEELSPTGIFTVNKIPFSCAFTLIFPL